MKRERRRDRRKKRRGEGVNKRERDERKNNPTLPHTLTHLNLFSLPPHL